MSRRYAAGSAEIGEAPAIKLSHVVAEAGEDDALRQLVRTEESGYGLDGNAGGAGKREAVGARGDGGEGDRSDGMVARQFHAMAIGRRQQRVFVLPAAV